jgi:hypothetical protein
MRLVVRFVSALLLLGGGITDVRMTLAQADPHDQSTATFESVSRVGGSTFSLALQGLTAYAHMGRRVAIFDLAEPAKPRLLGQTADQPEGSRTSPSMVSTCTWRCMPRLGRAPRALCASATRRSPSTSASSPRVERTTSGSPSRMATGSLGSRSGRSSPRTSDSGRSNE